MTEITTDLKTKSTTGWALIIIVFVNFGVNCAFHCNYSAETAGCRYQSFDGIEMILQLIAKKKYSPFTSTLGPVTSIIASMFICFKHLDSIGF